MPLLHAPGFFKASTQDLRSVVTQAADETQTRQQRHGCGKWWGARSYDASG